MLLMGLQRMTKITQADLALWLLRIGLAFVFLYAAISGFQDPAAWVGYLPNFMTKFLAPTTLLHFFELYEFALALWLLSGWYLRYAALLTALTLGGIVVTNPGQLLITFRDVGLLFMALALALTSKSGK